MSSYRRQHRYRSGSITVLTAVLIVVVLAAIAFSVDIGMLMVAKTDLQRAADAAAHAAALEYASNEGTVTVLSNVRRTARDWVPQNNILSEAPTVSTNWFNANPNGDIVLGRFDFANPSSPLDLGNPNNYNAVRVRIRRNEQQNGNVPLFFARVLGHNGASIEGEATVAVIRQVRGFKWVGENVPLLPIVIQRDYWENTMISGLNDDWSWNSTDGITENPDGISELVLYPESTGSSGNYGTVNIGGTSNATSHLSQQIEEGLSSSDFDFHGGELKLNDQGELPLGGDTGISNGIKDNIAAIAGDPRVIPLYDSVSGSGNNAEYIITKFVGVRIMSVNMTGSEKGITIQPADITVRGVIQGGTINGQQQSEQVFSPPTLVR